MASDPINQHNDLTATYGEDVEEQTCRYESIKAAFVKRFGSAPDLYARAPGRVNLIGEHIDYEGYGVLPMALHLDTVVAIRKAGDTLVLCNLEGDAYPEASFAIDPDQEVDVGAHSWANYFLAAYKGVWDHLRATGGAVPAPAGLQVLVHGRVPTGAGVSSSSAIVCACALGVLGAHGVTLCKGEVAEFTARAERYVGVSSGGMDQAISIMGQPGTAMHVEFNPVRASDVPLPPGATFVIANSLAVSNKAEGATGRYNLRVVECRLASAVLALGLGLSQADATTVRTLSEAEPLAVGKYGGGDKAAGTAAAEDLLHEAPYDTAELEALLGARLADMYEGDASALRVLRARTSFELRRRALHVYAEKQRVLDFAAVCRGGEAPGDKLLLLGELMDASQASCRDLYECSCPELDSLVAAAKSLGTLGSRLTGAGWGGCTVSLVREVDANEFIRQVTERYFLPLVDAGRLALEDLPQVVFASRPSSGAAVLRLKL